MEYIPGALLWVPDALSRRPDYKEISARDGLVEAGFVHPITGKPQRPPSASNSPQQFRPAAGRESRQGRAPLGVVDPNKTKERAVPKAKEVEGTKAVLAYSGALTWLDSPPLWLDALQTLQVAEKTYEEATLAANTRSGKKKSGKVAEPTASPAAEDASKNQRGDASTRLLEPSDRQDWKFRTDNYV